MKTAKEWRATPMSELVQIVARHETRRVLCEQSAAFAEPTSEDAAEANAASAEMDKRVHAPGVLR